MEPNATSPTAADYQALIDRIQTTLQSVSRAELSDREFAQQLNAINDHYRSLNLLRRMSRTVQLLSARPAKPRKTALNPYPER